MHTQNLICIYDSATKFQTGIGNSGLYLCCQKILFMFSVFAYSYRPLLDDMDVYAFTLILCNSLNYNLIDTKLSTIVHLLILYYPSELYGIGVLVILLYCKF